MSTLQSKSDLAQYYNINRKTLGVWLKKVYAAHPNEFDNCLMVKLFTPRQINIILNHLGEPKDTQNE